MASEESYERVYNSLSYGQFPDSVQTLVEESDFETCKEEFESEFENLLETKAKGVLKKAEKSDDKRMKLQLLGCLGTLLWLRKSNGLGKIRSSDIKSYRFNVGSLSTGDSIYIEYPGKKTTEDWHYLGPFMLDFAVNIEGWINSKGGQTPRHAEIFSDVYWKMKEAHLNNRPSSVNSLKSAITEIYDGQYPEEVLTRYDDNLEFSVGNEIEPLLHGLFWIAIQEDFNYPHGQGREMSYYILREICQLSPSEFTNTTPDYPDTVDIYDYDEYHDIITNENVKGFDPDDRGEMLSVSDITRGKFGI